MPGPNLIAPGKAASREVRRTGPGALVADGAEGERRERVGGHVVLFRVTGRVLQVGDLRCRAAQTRPVRGRERWCGREARVYVTGEHVTGQ